MAWRNRPDVEQPRMLMFNLDQAITEWRRQMIAGGMKFPEVLDEMESHLREDVEQQRLSGMTGERAFKIAVLRLGEAVTLREEFLKTRGTRWALLRKLKRILLGVDELPFPPSEDFAPAARQTLKLAPEEARHFHHDFIGTEHVLLGLTKSNSRIVSNVMQRLGVDGEAVRLEIQKIVHFGQPHKAVATIPFTPRARKALRLAADEARTLNQPRIGAEHILLGLIIEGSGVAAMVLKNLGVQLERAREEILTEMRANPDAV